MCIRDRNQKDWSPTFIPFAKARKRIETDFSQLCDQFMIVRNYAKDTVGLLDVYKRQTVGRAIVSGNLGHHSPQEEPAGK